MVENSELIKAKEVSKEDVVEKRIKPTLIRRRAKKADEITELPPAEVAAAAAAPLPEAKAPVAGSPVAPTVRATTPAAPVQQAPKQAPVGARMGLVPPKTKEEIAEEVRKAEEKAGKKSPRKKKSKAELLIEDIKKAGGLRHFAEQVMDTDEITEVTEVPAEVEAVVEAEAEVAAPVEVVVAPVAKPVVEEVKPETRFVEQTFERRRRIVRREFKKTAITQPKAIKKVIKIENAISVSDLSQRMGVKSSEIIRKLMALGTMATINQAVDVNTAQLIASEYGYEVQEAAFNEETVLHEVKEITAPTGHEILRPPVVTVMGHVDHGKTSVLDVIRKANVAAGEAGGITQHIGAYTVDTPNGTITFLDTPGHEAFTAMRSRGAKATDIVILVVAADDGVMPQTKEAIDHAKAAGVPIVVAINKIDKPNANMDKVKRELADAGIVPEEWGGDTICVPTSAKTKHGIDQLLEMVLLQAEMLERKADPSVPAQGVIVEARLDKGRGPVATALVQKGTLKIGDSIVSGLHWGRVRALISDRGANVDAAGPSQPVEVWGISGVPVAGDDFVVVKDDRAAKMVSENRQRASREKTLFKEARVSLEDLNARIAAGESKDLNVILKTDVHGSMEAICDALPKLSTDEVKVKILHSGVGGINESDVMLAKASDAVVIGFNVVADAGASRVANQEKVEVKFYSIIYEMLDEVKHALEGLLSPKIIETVVGRAEVRDVFHITKVGTVAGLSITKGKMLRSARIRLIRDSVVIHDGKISSLKRFKEDAREVSEGNECGLQLESYQDIKPGDIFEAYTIEEVARKLG